MDQALTLDAQSMGAEMTTATTEQSIIMYEKSVSVIESALVFYEHNRTTLSVSETQNSSDDEAQRIARQLGKIREQALDRLAALKNKNKSNNNNNNNNDTQFLNAGEEILDYIVVDDDEENSGDENTKKSNNNNNNDTTTMKRASELLSIERGAQLFYIADDGSVSTPSYPTTLSIYSLAAPTTTSQQVSAFIRVGEWVHPLVRNSPSPIMKTNFNAFIFPNEEQKEANDAFRFPFVGITFASHVDAEQRRQFDHLLDILGTLIHQDSPYSPSTTSSSTSSTLSTPTLSQPAQRPVSTVENKEKEKEKGDVSMRRKEEGGEEQATQPQQPPTMRQSTSSQQIAASIVQGAQVLSRGVAATGDYAINAVASGSRMLRARVQPATEPVVVDPSVQSLLRNVRYGTHVSVRVSSYLVDKLSSLANAAATRVAPHLRDASVNLLHKSGLAGADRVQAAAYVENACTVAQGTLEGLAIVGSSLEQAAVALGRNITENTVTLVDHK